MPVPNDDVLLRNSIEFLINQSVGMAKEVIARINDSPSQDSNDRYIFEEAQELIEQWRVVKADAIHLWMQGRNQARQRELNPHVGSAESRGPLGLD